MAVIISGRGVTLSRAFKALVERKLGRLARGLPEGWEARVVCEAEKFRRTVRLRLRAGRRALASEATAGDLAAAVDTAVEALRRQLREARDRRRPVKGRGPARPGPRPGPAPAGEETAAGPVVPRRLVAKPMSVDEAVMQLGLDDRQFLVFRNARSGDVNVLYRRRDGGLALIEPA